MCEVLFRHVRVWWEVLIEALLTVPPCVPSSAPHCPTSLQEMAKGRTVRGQDRKQLFEPDFCLSLMFLILLLKEILSKQKEDIFKACVAEL